MIVFSESEKRLGSVICNIIFVVLELVSLVISTIENGWAQFQYYTQNSNYFALIVSVIFLIVTLRCFKRGCDLPLWVSVLRYIATALLTVTFLVVIFVLSPPYGWTGFRFTLFTGAMTFQHLLCPLLSFFSFLLFERRPIGKAAPFLALIPTILYALISTLLNVLKLLHGPYPFLYVYEQPVWQSILYGVVIVGGAFLVAELLWIITKKKKNIKKNSRG